MTDVVIENPVINSPFEEPARHFKFAEQGITDEIATERRPSSYFVPIPGPKRKGKAGQMVFDTQWTRDRIQENTEINRIREKVAVWRDAGHPDVTRTTARLLEYWTGEDRNLRLFFCQVEALETVIYVTEVAKKYGDTWIENALRKANEEMNPGLLRMALKMATGSGKTVVMAMLIAWHVLNKRANPQDARFTDAFLIVTPGITIRDRLRVLLPSDPQNYYRAMEIVPPERRGEIASAKIVITNFHAFLRREKIKAAKRTKEMLAQGDAGAFTESEGEMVRRVCRSLGNKKKIIVINDEAHHCYRGRRDKDAPKLKGDERKEAASRNKKARVWISGLEAVQKKIGIKTVYDLSATPFFLRGSGHGEGTLFPWVVSDFSLIDAIECGIVKVPRVPVADNAMTGTMPTYRDLWSRIREDLPRKGRSKKALTREPRLPAELEGALHSLYENYEKYYRAWEQDKDAQEKGATPPVFIVVCNNCSVSKLVYDYIAGWEKELPEGSPVLVPGQLPTFSNVQDGTWTARPNTILIDSEELESGEAMSREFKKIAANEIEEFKSEIRERFPGRDVEKLTDEDLLREVMNTVGKKDRLGEQVKCVVSVSMLTEGWDANTVTHILGVRAFGTQLLCEQVVGRGLRRRSYATKRLSVQAGGESVEVDAFPVEYAEVYGVPFSFIPCAESAKEPMPTPPPVRVRALEEREHLEITFPRLVGYRYEVTDEPLSAEFNDDYRMTLSTEDVPTKTENRPIVGETTIHTLDDLKSRRMQEVGFLLAKLVLEKYFRKDGSERTEHKAEHRFDAEVKAWRFPEILSITRRWLDECVRCKDNAFPQLLLLIEYAHDASDRIYRGIVRGAPGEKRLLPILRTYEPVGSTRYVDFDTTRPVYVTDERFCHVSHVVADTESWEQKAAQALEEFGEEGLVLAYVKNHSLGFLIPYVLAGEQRNYVPDFIVRIDDGHGTGDPLNLIVEVTGQRKKDKEAKAATARDLWVPAVNNHGGFGRWAFIEIKDPWDAKNLIRTHLERFSHERRA